MQREYMNKAGVQKSFDSFARLNKSNGAHSRLKREEERMSELVREIHGRWRAGRKKRRIGRRKGKERVRERDMTDPPTDRIVAFCSCLTRTPNATTKRKRVRIYRDLAPQIAGKHTPVLCSRHEENRETSRYTWAIDLYTRNDPLLHVKCLRIQSCRNSIFSFSLALDRSQTVFEIFFHRHKPENLPSDKQKSVDRIEDVIKLLNLRISSGLSDRGITCIH